MNTNGPDDEDETPLLDEIVTACLLNGSNTEVGVWEVTDADNFINDLSED